MANNFTEIFSDFLKNIFVIRKFCEKKPQSLTIIMICGII